MKLYEHLEVAASPHGTGIKARRDIPAGTPLFHIRGNPGREPEMYSIQLDETLHVHPENHLWRLVNHSCAPNCLIDFKTWTFVTAREVRKDEELSFNYLTTEYLMAAPFRCGCASPCCHGEIRGFKALPPAKLEELAPQGSPYFLRHLFETVPLPSEKRRPGAPFAQWRPAVYALVPYETRDGKLDGGEYDCPQYRALVRSWFAGLGLPYRWVPVTPENTARTVEKLRGYAAAGDILAFNLCDGSEQDGRPGVSLLRALEAASIPFTGAASDFYEFTTSKLLMKEKLAAGGVPTAPYLAIKKPEDAARLGAVTGYPVLFKPDISSASWGITLKSYAPDEPAAARYAGSYLSTPEAGYGLLAERFVDGPEFTVLAAADLDSPDGVRVYPAVERYLNPLLPRHERFLSYGRYWGEYTADEPPLPEGEEFMVYRPAAPGLQERLAGAARRAFLAVNGKGYARIDLRMEERTGELFVLEVNSNPSFSSEERSSLGGILRFAGVSISALLTDIFKDAFRRSARA